LRAEALKSSLRMADSIIEKNRGLNKRKRTKTKLVLNRGGLRVDFGRK
jgi:hypothetical protein